MAAIEIPTAEDVRRIVREEIERALRSSGPDVLTTDQAAARAGVSPKTVRAWVEAGTLHASRRGRRLAIRREDLDAVLAGDAAAPAAAASEAWQRMRRAG